MDQNEKTLVRPRGRAQERGWGLRRGARQALWVVCCGMVALLTACSDDAVINPLPEAPGGPNAALRLEACTVPNVTREALCGELLVAENPNLEAGRTIPLNIIVVKGGSTTPDPDPVFVITGGPGSPATALAAAGLEVPFPFRDVVYVDARGTGLSNSLSCRDVPVAEPLDLDTLFSSRLPVDFLKACRDDLARRADLTQYTTTHIADDLDAVRAALGYAAVNLWSISYGTRVAQVYLRRYPEHVRTAILIGVAPVADFRIPLPYARDTQTAFEGLLAVCERDAACHNAFPALRTEVDSIAARLTRAPVAVDIPHVDTGDTVTVHFSLPNLSDALRRLLLDSATYRAIPAMLHRAYKGDWSDWVDAYLGRVFVFGNFSTGLYLSVICTEDVPWIEEGEIAAAVEGTYLGDTLIRDTQAVCEFWPRGAVEAGFHDPVISDIPVLLISGTLDPATPPDNGDEVALHLSNSRHLVIPDGSHGPWTVPSGGGCGNAMIRQFVERARVDVVNATCLSTLSAPAFDVRGAAQPLSRPPMAIVP